VYTGWTVNVMKSIAILEHYLVTVQGPQKDYNNMMCRGGYRMMQAKENDGRAQ